MAWRDDAQSTLHSAITDALEPGSMVTSWVLVAQVIAADGTRCVCSNTADDQRNIESLGLLRWATVVEESAIEDED